jgi:hypothetical protein
MAAGAWTIYDQFSYKLGTKTVNLSLDTMKIALYQSTSNVGNKALATATYASATNEVANANGYTAGGAAAAATWVNASGTETFDCADVSWTASGGSIVARYAVIYDSTTGDLIAYSLLDTTPADVTIASGSTLQLQINVAGVFTLS